MCIADGVSLEARADHGKYTRSVEIVENAREKKKRGPFSSISFPTPLIKEVGKVVEELGYWPTKTAFIREAVMEKHRKELEARSARESSW